MEKIQQNVAEASEEQCPQFEVQLLDLPHELHVTEELHVAEEKNKRLSMAQQTKTGHVYIISNVGSFGEGVFKIGLTRRLEPLDRIRELGDACVPFEFDVHAMILSEDAPALEHALHRHFLASQINKVNPQKEFFRVTIGVLREESPSTYSAKNRRARHASALDDDGVCRGVQAVARHRQRDS